MKLTNLKKWYIALPFAALVTIIIPGIVTSDLFWFFHDWMDTLFVFLSTAMWLIATAFVDSDLPRGPRDLANLLIPLGLNLSLPIERRARTPMKSEVLFDE